MVFPTFFNLCLNLAIRSSWSGPIEDLKIKKKKLKEKNDHENSKNISRTISGVVVGSVGQFLFG